MRYDRWKPYVPVAKRIANAKKESSRLQKKGAKLQPIRIDGAKIANTFWGLSWCEHLEKFSDYSNRLPRGRSYVRNGSVFHLEVQKGMILAKVSGSDLYEVEIKITHCRKEHWQRIKSTCAGQIGSLLELLQGKLSKQVMEKVTDRDNGLFPLPSEIELSCSCPDWATMCKHVAAVMYGVGARLDAEPELLFLLRGVDHNELVTIELSEKSVVGKKKTARKTISDNQLSDIFGIDLAPAEAAPAATKTSAATAKKRKAPAAVSAKQPAKQTAGPRAKVTKALKRKAK